MLTLTVWQLSMLHFCEVAEAISALTPFTKSSMLALPSAKDLHQPCQV
jgi:hypothetical protein